MNVAACDCIADAEQLIAAGRVRGDGLQAGADHRFKRQSARPLLLREGWQKTTGRP